MKMFQDETFSDICEKLVNYGVGMKQSVFLGYGGSLRDLTFCVTGTLSKPREEIWKIIELNGGEIHTSVKKATEYLVAGENVGKTKTDKAKKYGCTIITESDLYDMLNKDSN